MKLDEARAIAEEVRLHLSPFCQRIEIAGSVRRLKPDVHDIELVAIPKYDEIKDLFGTVLSHHSRLTKRLLAQFGTVIKGGDRYIQVALEQGIKLDLFIVLPPADWGVIYTIRTGPADFSKWIVTLRMRGGALPDWALVANGCVWDRRSEVRILFKEEKDFLKFLGLGWIEPSERVPKWGACYGSQDAYAFLWPTIPDDAE